MASQNNTQNSVKKPEEVKILKKAVLSTIMTLWAVFPMHVLGWLTSAVARHPLADKELQQEAVYKFLLLWQGGAKFLGAWMLLIGFFILLIVLSILAYKFEYSSIDGMGHGRQILSKFLIPAYLSAAAFASGLFAQTSFVSLGYAGSLLLTMAVLPFLVFCLIEYIETLSKEQHNNVVT